MAWDDLRLFRVVAEELSFTRAAERAQVSQPSLSTRVKRLERRLGVVLFDRSTRRVQLTPAGRLVLTGVTAMASAWSGTIITLDAAQAATGWGRPARALRLGLYDVGPVRLPLYTDTLAPGGCTVLTQGDVNEALVALTDGKLDLLFCYYFDPEGAPAPPAGVRTATVVRERLHVLLPRTHPLAARSSVSLNDLSSEQWIVHANPALARTQVNLLRRYGVDANVTHTTSDTKTQQFLIATGQAVDLTSPLYHPHPDIVARPLTEAVSSDFRLCIASQMDATIAEAAVDALRRWYVDGLIERSSPWLKQMDRPDAHPTLRAALATSRYTPHLPPHNPASS